MQLDLEPVVHSTAVFHYGLPERSGLARYLHLIAAPNDPDETRARGEEARENGARGAGWQKRTGTAEEWRSRIVAHLADGQPRTFNRICVELAGARASGFHESEAEAGLWLAVERRELLLTHETPIYFVDAGHVLEAA